MITPLVRRRTAGRWNPQATLEDEVAERVRNELGRTFPGRALHVRARDARIKSMAT